MRMKKISTLIIILIISISSFSQKIEYAIDVGGNYSFFSSSIYKSTGKFGFQINNDFTLPFNKYLSLKTGIGLRILNVDLTYSENNQMTYFTGTTPETLYNNRQPFILPGSVIVIYEDSTIIGYVDNADTIYFDDRNPLNTKSNYNLLFLSIPLQLQVGFFNKKLLLTTGMTTSAIIYAKNTFQINNGKTHNEKANNDFSNIFISLNIGIGYNIFNNIYARVNFEHSISNIKNELIDPEMFGLKKSDLHLNNISLNLTYKFWKPIYKKLYNRFECENK